jgi:hypothetical protein
MMKRKLQTFLAAAFILSAAGSNAQLTIQSGATFQIQSGAVVTVQGDITSSVDITGPGKVLLKGSANQNVNMNGFTVPNLEMDNAAGATLTGNARIGTDLLFTNGKIQAGNFNLTFSNTATNTGGGTSKFVETAGTGSVVKELTADITNYSLPVGSGTDYLPIAITNTGSTYASAKISVQSKGVADPNKHPRTESFLTNYWTVAKTGITGGTTNAVGTYVDPTRVTGTEADLRGIFWDGTNWSLAGGTQNTATNTAGANVTTASGEVYAMNKFVVSRLKALLQGPLNTGTMIMNDNLRTAPVLIPTADPYRVAPYSTSFIHNAGNTPAETVNATVFNNAALTDNDIVDWVFVELRQGVSPGNVVVMTRSALIQRDGDIVDVDGVSPVYFKNLDANTNYSIGVRHRNHLGIYTNTAAAGNLFSLGLSSGSTIDLSSLPAASLFGSPTTNYAVVSGRNVMYAGNVLINTNIRWNAPSSDKDFLLVNILSGNSATVLSNVYSLGDVNLNRGVRWNSPNSDKDFILLTPLQSLSSNVRSQVSPN